MESRPTLIACPQEDFAERPMQLGAPVAVALAAIWMKYFMLMNLHCNMKMKQQVVRTREHHCQANSCKLLECA